MKINYTPTLEELIDARAVFLANEPRDLFYKVAIELIGFTLKGKTDLTISESIGVLLQTWNQRFYLCHQTFDEKHFNDIDQLLKEHKWLIDEYRPRDIFSLDKKESQQIDKAYHSFEIVLGPVGAAKALHVLAPRFFPLLDRKIAQKGYSLYLDTWGHNSNVYYEFTNLIKIQCIEIREKYNTSTDYNLVKLLDEYNFCRYAKGWI